MLAAALNGFFFGCSAVTGQRVALRLGGVWSGQYRRRKLSRADLMPDSLAISSSPPRAFGGKEAEGLKKQIPRRSKATVYDPALEHKKTEGLLP